MAGAGSLRLVEPGLVLESTSPDETWRRGWGILLAPRAPRPHPRGGGGRAGASGAADVVVEAVGPLEEVRRRAEALAEQWGPCEVLRLPEQAFAPGFVNAHSHAFQIALRGRGECYGGWARTSGSHDFWTWRAEMYRLVERIDRAEMFRHCTQAFREMLQAGITCVGEFHYLHHPAEAAAGAQGSDEGCTYELDDVLVEAAQAAGIRLVMLCTHYERTGFGGQPVSGPQRRFFSPSTDGLAAHVARMEAKYDATLDGGDHPAVTFGFAAHSLRATGLPDLVALSDECLSRGAKLHVHLEEQTEEVDSCKRHHQGATPMSLLLGALPGRLDHVTAVHCTHTLPMELAEFVGRGGRVCVCPATEGALGDGIPPLGDENVAFAAAVRCKVQAHLWEEDGGGGERGEPLGDSYVCLGTDCNASIDFQSEMRWLEYGQRLRFRRRGVLTHLAPMYFGARRPEGRPPDAPPSLDLGTAVPVSWQLFQAATLGGARSLGVDAGHVAPQALADFCALDLAHPLLREAAAGSEDLPSERLLDLLVFTGAPGAVAAAWVNGRPAWEREK